MASTAADILMDTLMDWGVEVIFGLPGDGINGLMESLRRRKDRIRFIHVRHEEAAAFMACAYAKYTRKLGVCLATSGPGGIHLLNGLYDAKLDGQPVLAITGHHYHDLIGTFSQQDVDLDKLFMDVAAYSQRVMGPSHVQNVTDLACRIALGKRTVTHINFPADIQDMTALAIQGPALVQAVVDPLTPPMPAKITARQAAMFAEATLRGTEDAASILRTVMGDKLREMI
ncbi:MAG: thiamine pyrophosphate-binding protein [Polyangiaceae bacterium]